MLKSMKRKALLIGNTDGLPGISKDLKDFRKYLMSEIGGCWKCTEIVEKLNLTKSKLEELIKTTKDEDNDFVIVVFSGHGGVRNQTYLYINPQDEYIEESKIKNLAPRQITIMDCCWSPLEPEPVTEGLNTRTFSCALHHQIRETYDKYIMTVPPQQLSLYACRVGECAQATDDGSLFIQSLISCLKAICSSVPFARFSNVFPLAAECTTRQASNMGENQHPDYCAPKFKTSFQLLLGYNINKDPQAD